MLRSAIALLILVFAATAHAGTISRPLKNNGTTAWAANDLIRSAEMNADFDTVYNLVNGDLDTTNLDAAAGILGTQIASDTITNTNVSSSAAIAVSKLDQTAGQLDADIVDDYSADAAESIVVTDPGVTGTPSLATNLQEEIARLRYAIKRLAVGTTAETETGAVDASWYDLPVRGGNLAFNGSFELKSAASPAAPDGWALVGTPTTVAQAETAVTLGEGKELNIVAQTSAAEGISQTFAGLEASGKYLVGVYAKAATGSDTCGLVTTGAASGDFDDLALTTSSTTYVPLYGVVALDSTPTNLVVQLLSDANAQADDCDYDHAFVYRIGAAPNTGPGETVQSIHKTTSQTFSSATYAAVTGLTTAVTVPGPGYWLETFLDVGMDKTGGGTATAKCQILENAVMVTQKKAFFDSTNEKPMSMHHVLTNPTPGTTYTYTVECAIGTGSIDVCDSADEGSCRLTTALRKAE